MCELFAINVIWNLPVKLITICVVVEHNVYVVAKLLNIFLCVLNFFTWVLNFEIFLQSLKTRN